MHRSPLRVVAAVLALAALVPMWAESQELRNTPPAPQETQSPSHTLELKLPAQPITVRTLSEPKSAWIDLLPHLLTSASVVVALFAAYWSAQAARSGLTQAAHESEMRDLQQQLDGFYGPYIQRSEANKLLIDELRARQADPAKFRTLVELLDPAWRSKYSRSDQTLIEEIVRNDTLLHKLIHTHTGLVSAAIIPYLARASAHFRIMRLALNGKLENEPQRFDRYVYPRQLDQVLEIEVNRLTARINALRAASDKRLPAPPTLQIPAHLALPPWP